jgi:hypothetical protein
MVGRQLGKLLVDQEPMLRRRDDEDALRRDNLLDPVDGVLQEAALTDKIEELLRAIPA